MIEVWKGISMNWVLVLVTLVLSSHLSHASEKLKWYLPDYSQVYSEKRSAVTDLEKAIDYAQSSQRLILVEMGGDWCVWCHKLDEFLKKHPQVNNALHNRFVLLKVNVSSNNDNKEFFKHYPKPNAYPHMLVLNSYGRFVYEQDTAEFLIDKHYSQSKLSNFIESF